MAYYIRHQSAGIGERLAAATAHAFQRIAARYAHYRIYRASLNELHGLSNRALADLGLNRSMLKSVALEAADKKVAT